MAYTIDQTELAISNEQRRLKLSDDLNNASAFAYLLAWGAYRRNEVDREVGLKAPATAAVRSGEALEEKPDIPHITITDEEAEAIGGLVALLKGYDQWCLRQRFRTDEKTVERMLSYKHFRVSLRKAIDNFSRLL